MNYINVLQPNIVKAKDTHFLFMRYIIKRKMFGNAFKEASPFPKVIRINKVSGIKSSIIKFLSDETNLKKVLIGTPEELDTIKSKFTSIGLKKSINRLLNYDSWIKTDDKSTYRYYNAYHLAENLDIPTCIYCNRSYTKTVITDTDQKITRPTFDHWFPKSLNPLLVLSFHNLIPSCAVCNSGVKGAAPFELNTHFHPYYDNPSERLTYSFSYDHRDYHKFSFKILTHGSVFSETSIKAFKLEEIFKAHEDEIEDLRKIKDAYSDSYLDMLESKILGGVVLDRHEIYRLAFGTHLDESKFDRRPLSKMKRDILTELGIIP